MTRSKIVEIKPRETVFKYHVFKRDRDDRRIWVTSFVEVDFVPSAEDLAAVLADMPEYACERAIDRAVLVGLAILREARKTIDSEAVRPGPPDSGR